MFDATTVVERVTDVPNTGPSNQLAPRLNNIQVVTLADSKHLRRPYVVKCVHSWRRIRGADEPFWVLDAGIEPGDEELANMVGLVQPPAMAERLAEGLKNWPALREIRDRFITWRKLIDTVILFRDVERVLFLDTDVYIASPIAFPVCRYDFMYQCDDVPAYRGEWYLPLFEPMVVSLNAGFMLFTPAKVDLDELERITKRYFLQSKKMWWTVQAVISAVMAASGSCAIFDGRDVRTFSGNRKRSLREIETNCVKMRGRSEDITTEAEATELLKGAAVLHFAGHGKAWLDLAESFDADNIDVRLMRVAESRPARPWQRVLIAGRMLATQLLK